MLRCENRKSIALTELCLSSHLLLFSFSSFGRGHQLGECMLTRPDSHHTITKVLIASIATTEGRWGGAEHSRRSSALMAGSQTEELRQRAVAVRLRSKIAERSQMAGFTLGDLQIR